MKIFRQVILQKFTLINLEYEFDDVHKFHIFNVRNHDFLLTN